MLFYEIIANDCAYLMTLCPGQGSAGPTSRWKKLLVGVLVIGVAGAAGMLRCMIR